MMTFSSYEELQEILADAFRQRYKRSDANLVGLLFARPEAPFARDNVVPHIDYWHWRSDNWTDFFCPGYSPNPPRKGARAITTVNGHGWFFSNEHFVSFLKVLEQRTTWHYSGGSELLIVNARATSTQRKVRADLDFTSAIAVDLEAAQKQKAINDPSAICEDLFQFAKHLNEATADPVWDFSDRQGKRVIRGSLKELLLAALPSTLRPEAKKAFHFVTVDISQRSA